MAQIFISYASKDHLFVDRLRGDLRRGGIDYWIDREGLSPGTPSWERAIRDALRGCESVLWIVSPDSFESPYVRDEISIALLYRRRIYPVFAKGDNWLECVPLGKGEIQYIDARTDYDGALTRIVEALGAAASPYVMLEEPTPELPGHGEPRNPYKGLNAFTEKDAGDFFGRSALVAELKQMMEERTVTVEGRDRLLAVLGPSGAGKSSVVMAGLLPTLGSDWYILPRVAPGKQPIESLADTLYRALGGSLAGIEQDLRSGSRYLARLVRPLGKRVLLYIDQFEEVFTLTAGINEAEREAERQRFIDLLTYACTHTESNLFVVLTMRADFYDRPMHYDILGPLITRNQVSVLPMSISELYEAIQKPARLPDVALQFDEGLVSEIVFELRARSAAMEGALPFLEFTLTRLFELRDGQRLPRTAYETIGGVEGAISSHADALYAGIETRYGADVTRQALGRIFLPLTNIDMESGKATRKRALQSEMPGDAVGQALFQNFVEGRLLQTGRDGDAYVEVAHEALFRSWARLKDWIASAQEDLILLRQMRAAAHDWQTKGRPDYLLWPQERLVLVYAMIERPRPELSEVERDFIEPELVRLERELARPETTHDRRLEIGNRLEAIGDNHPGVGVKDGIPDILWLPVEVPSEPVTIETDEGKIGPVIVHPFFISKYLVTYVQYQVFADAEDGYGDDRWWDGMPEDFRQLSLARQQREMANLPRDSISWYQAVAFARWVSYRQRGLELAHPEGALHVGDNAEIRLPTEWEWQWAAQGGTKAKAYPWGDWRRGYSNTSESGLGRAIAVGMYPHGAAACGALDMAGNLWEWCANNHDKPKIIDPANTGSKVLRGGSFGYGQGGAAASYRSFDYPLNDINFYGVRLVLAAPISAL